MIDKKLNRTSLAKITPPTLPQVFPRHRLFRKLDHAGRRPVTWVAGPAGCGKTTLVRSYIDSRELLCLWYQVDQGDTDIATFFHYLGLAAKKTAPRRKASLPHLTPEYTLGVPTFARSYFRKLYGWLNIPFAIVFDNLQEVASDAILYGVLEAAVNEIPEGGRIILISRSGPPPNTTRWQANRAMSVLGWEELKLTSQESNGITRLIDGRKPAGKTIKQLQDRAGGWAAGLVLMLQWRGDGSPTSGKAIPDEAIFNYFAGEIFEKLPPKIQNFLLRTSFLPHMTARTAIQLTGMKQANHILAGLCLRHTFTERFVSAEPSYQYHALFREFLLARAGVTFSPALLSRVRQTAARLLEAEGQVEYAAELLHQNGDWKNLIPLIMKQAPTLLNQGRSETLELWLREVPRARLERNPWLLYWLGNCRLIFDPHEARKHLEKAFNLFKDNGDPAGIFLAWAGVVETFFFQWDAYYPLDKWIAALEDLLKVFRDFPSPEIEVRVTTGMLGALTFRQPQHPDIEHWVEKAALITKNSPDINIRMKNYFLMLAYYIWTGNFTKLAGVVEEANELAKMREANPLVIITSKSLEADFLWLAPSPEACLRAVSEGLELAQATGIHILDRELLAYGTYGALTGGDIGAAKHFLQQLKGTLADTSRLDAAHFHYLSGWEAAYRNDFEQALQHAEKAYSLAVALGAPFQEAVTSIGLAQVHTERDEYRRADTCLDRSHKIGRDIRSVHIEHLCALTEASLAMRRHQEERCLVSLNKAMALGRQYGFWTIPWWRPSMMVGLCLKALENNIEVSYVQELIRKRNLIPEETPFHVDNWPWALRISTLGNFEVRAEGEPLRFIGKVSLKPLELLKALVAFGGRNVSRERLTDTLWPDAEGDDALRVFDTTLHRLRRMTGNEGAFILQGGKLSLNPWLCWLDTWSLLHLLNTLEASSAGGNLSPRDIERLTEKAFALYRGPFLINEGQHPWLIHAGQRLRSQFTRLLLAISGYWEREEQWLQAADVYRRGLEVDELGEGIRRRLDFCDEAYLSGLKSRRFTRGI